MPIYEYRCQSCNEIMEALVRSGKEPTACTTCGAESLTRLISRAGIIFKGSGFYVNDSKGTSSSSSTGGSESKASKSSGDSDSKSNSSSSDSKPSESTSKKESSSD